MLTRQGWLVAIGAVVLVAAGRTFGIVELFICGAAAGAAALLAVASVALTRLRLAVARTVTPSRVYAGTPSKVDLVVRNDGGRRTRVLRLFDPVTGTRGADLLLAPLEPELSSRAAYRLPTDRRGIVRIGPLEVIATDPFGLASTATVAAPATELTVFPRVDDIVAVPHTSGHDPHAGAEHPSALGRSGDDFYALRDYVQGDDHRRIHWPSTARRDELMVRQDELPWQGRVTVVLDVRRSANSEASLELTTSAAASILTASWKRRDLVRLATTDGVDFGFAAGTAHAEAMMEHLAVVQLAGDGSLRGTLAALTSKSAGGAVVVVLADAGAQDLGALALQRQSFSSLSVVRFQPSAWQQGAAPEPTPVGGGFGGHDVVVTTANGFAEAWNRTMTAPTAGGRRPRVGARR